MRAGGDRGHRVEGPKSAGLEHLRVGLDIKRRQGRHGVAAGAEVEVGLDEVHVDRQAQQLADRLQLAAGDVEHLAVWAARALALLPPGQRFAVEVLVAAKTSAAPALRGLCRRLLPHLAEQLAVFTRHAAAVANYAGDFVQCASPRYQWGHNIRNAFFTGMTEFLPRV